MTPAVIQWQTWGLAEWLIFILVVVAIVAIFWIVLTRGLGVKLPDWVIQVFWVVVAVVFGAIAIRLVASLL